MQVLWILKLLLIYVFLYVSNLHHLFLIIVYCYLFVCSECTCICIFSIISCIILLAFLLYTIKIQDTIEEKLKNTIKYELYKNGNKIELQKNETTKMELTNKEQQEDKYQLKIVYIIFTSVILPVFL